MLKRLIGFVIGLALCLLAIIYEWRQNAAERTAFREGETGTLGGSFPSLNQPIPHHGEGTMQKQRFELPYWVWLVIFCFGLYFILAVSGCAGVYTSVEMVEMPQYFGKAECDMNNHPIIKIRKDTANYAYRYTLVHEHEHANRMRRYGCTKFLQRYLKDTSFAFNEEAMAYCAEARVMIQNGVNAKAAVEYASLHSQAHPRGQHLKIDSVRKVLPCRGLQDAKLDTLMRPPN